MQERLSVAMFAFALDIATDERSKLVLHQPLGATSLLSCWHILPCWTAWSTSGAKKLLCRLLYGSERTRSIRSILYAVTVVPYQVRDNSRLYRQLPLANNAVPGNIFRQALPKLPTSNALDANCAKNCSFREM